jgi:adenylosuccinate synthase
MDPRDHVIVVGLGYGDEAKGATTDFLAARAEQAGTPLSAVVRFNGGAQAAHNVVLPDGTHHTFAQFGSATLRGVPTLLSRNMLVEPFAVLAEADALARKGVPDPLSLVSVDPDALLTTPWHWLVNRAKENARGDGRHGSCGRGIGETMAWALDHPDLAPRVADIADRAVLARKLGALRGWALTVPGTREAAGPGTPDHLTVLADPHDVVDAYRALAARVRVAGPGLLRTLLDAGPVVFEGAQGVLLDEWHGWHPYTTWSTTTTQNALGLLADAGRPAGAFRLGLVRTVTTRHGAGPLVGDDPALAGRLDEPHNGLNPWQRAFRVAPFDAVAHAYALAVSPCDGLSVSHLDWAPPGGLDATVEYRVPDGTRLDRLAPVWDQDLDRQEQVTRMLGTATAVVRREPGRPQDAVGRLLGLPVVLTAAGPTARDRQAAAGDRPGVRVGA